MAIVVDELASTSPSSTRRGGDVIEQVPIVTDDDEATAKLARVSFEPSDRR